MIFLEIQIFFSMDNPEWYKNFPLINATIPANFR